MEQRRLRAIPRSSVRGLPATYSGILVTLATCGPAATAAKLAQVSLCLSAITPQLSADGPDVADNSHGEGVVCDLARPVLGTVSGAETSIRAGRLESS
ncbi:hypothetical protein ElyMa_005213300 [Elysia marginata]|uniref:Uncharacterized protein n=1 Tax=Elysia marginata TaxID=1093978 RepID=A0AAV4JZR0_9GAST|nr:hypothetical protein ElyMa_005213300 [Elysia marginata]